jgi:DNA-binding NtrC family response regulator
MTTHTALIVDDEPDIRDLLNITLTRMGVKALTAADLGSAYKLLGQHKFDLCLTDMNLPDGNGIELVQWIQAHAPTTPVAVITAYGSMDTAIESLKAGAFDFVSKPVELPRLRELVNSALKLAQPKEQLNNPADEPGLLLGNSAQIQKLRKQTRKLARSQAPVFISGESGSGKELVARMIHLQGPRCDGPFIAVNCGAIPSELMESEFFGHKKGSFTGAVENKDGLFRSANGGTLFLDEIGDMPLPMQVKLLRVLQERQFERVGGTKTLEADVRIIAATHKDLESMIAAGDFREDLYYRLNVFPIEMPALRERLDDLPLLVNALQSRLKEEGIGSFRFHPSALESLLKHPWDGNVRELSNLMERLAIIYPDAVVGVSELPAKFRHVAEPDPERYASQGLTGTAPISDHSLSQQVQPFTPGGVQLPEEGIKLKPYLEELEQSLINQALDRCDYVVARAADELGVRRTTLVEKMRKYGISRQ